MRNAASHIWPHLRQGTPSEVEQRHTPQLRRGRALPETANQTANTQRAEKSLAQQDDGTGGTEQETLMADKLREELNILRSRIKAPDQWTSVLDRHEQRMILQRIRMIELNLGDDERGDAARNRVLEPENKEK